MHATKMYLWFPWKKIHSRFKAGKDYVTLGLSFLFTDFELSNNIEFLTVY